LRIARANLGFMKRIVASAALVALSVFAALGLGEVAARLLFKDQTVMFPRYHTDYRYGPYTLRGIRPNSEFWHRSVDGSWKFVTNRKGLRNTRDFDHAKPAGTLRVLSLGDSHTQGYEVRQDVTFSAVLERYLAKRGVRAEVLNAGVSGYSTAEALLFLENEGYKYQPDVVVLGFYANDFRDNLKAGLFALEGEHLVERKREHIPGVRIQNLIYSLPGVQWLGENSYLYSILFNGVWIYFKIGLAQASAGGTAPDDAPDVEYAVATKKPHSAHEVALAAALVERMQKFCRERGIRLIVVDIPRPNKKPYELIESVAPGELKALEFISSRELFAEFDSAAELHVAHGQRHISEFTHTLIGVELGRRILQR
jgi:hypothetical protein